MSCQQTRPHAHCTFIPAGLMTRLPPACSQAVCVRKQGEIQVKIMPGGYYIGYGNLRIATTLGSCVSACVRDPFSRIGGMNHFLLPAGCATSCECWSLDRAERYGVNAMETLINELVKRGARRERLEFKLFGGGHVLRDSTSDVGARNVAFIKEYVKTERLKVSAADLGGFCSRRVVFDVSTGKVLLKQTSSEESAEIRRRDKRYVRTLCDTAPEGSVELF